MVVNEMFSYLTLFILFQTWQWWLMRCLGVHQSILDDKSPTLKTAILQLIDECEYILYKKNVDR